MVLVVREWIEEARHKHSDHRDEGRNAPLALTVGELLSWGAEVLEVAALALAAVTLLVRLRGMRGLHHSLHHCGEIMERGSVWYVELHTLT